MKIFILSLFLGATLFAETNKPSETQLYGVKDERGNWGWIDNNGNVVVEPQARFRKTFNSRGGFATFIESQRMGAISLDGKVTIPAGEYYEILSFQNGYALAKKTKDSGKVFIDTVGKIAEFTPEGKYEDIYPFFEGLAAVKLPQGKWGFIDIKGTTVIDHQYASVFSFSEGVSRVTLELEISEVLAKDISKYFFIDRNNQRVSPADLDSETMGFFHGRARFKKGPMYGFYDKNFDPVVSAQFAAPPSHFTHGFSSVTLETRYREGWESYVGIIDTDGEFTFGPVWIGESDKLSPVVDGVACILRDGKAGVIYVDGEFAIQPEYDTCEAPRDGAVVLGREDQQFLFRVSDAALLWQQKK